MIYNDIYIYVFVYNPDTFTYTYLLAPKKNHQFIPKQTVNLICSTKKIHGGEVEIFLSKVGRFGRSFSFSAAAHALWAQSRDGPKQLGIRFCCEFSRGL